jgi:DNA-binding NarL/FixJ family response regulator
MDTFGAMRVSGRHPARVIEERSPRRRDARLHPMTAVGVLVVDNREASRRAARELVSAMPGFDWLAEAASAEEALEAAVALRPQLALVEVDMPGIDGIETSRRLTAAVPETTVVLVAAERSAGALESSGAAAFLPRAELSPAAVRALWERYGPD